MTSLIILLLLFTSTSPTLSLSTASSNSSPLTTTIFSQICPSECDCEEITTDFKQSVTINCYNGGLNSTDFSKILENLPTTINILEIRAPASQPNSFEWNDNLNRFQRLERLSMINCGIPSISQSARLKSLQHLDLHGNHIDYLYMTTFAGLTSLELLDLSHNRLSNLPSGVFNLIKKLKFLNLAHNRLSTLATNLLLGPKNLHTLQLDGNKITAKQINEQFSDIKSLQRLEINDCGLGDDGISHLKLSKIENLKRLGVGGNNLTKVPSATLRNLPNLETLDLTKNRIRALEPCSFCSCNITEILLGHNLLGIDDTAISPEAFADTRITALDLSFNYFDQFDASILGMAQTSIRILDLSGNNLGGFHHRLTYSLISLSHLHMAANGIKDIPANLPYEYTRLQFLNISKNRIDYLPDDIASLLPSIRVMDLSHNFITTFTPTVMSTFINSLDMLYLHHNPIDCRCVTQSLQHYMLQRHAYATELRYADTQCATPELLSGRPVHRVQHVNDCAIFFGASYGITQVSELLLLLLALLFGAVLVAIFVLAVMTCGKKQKYKGTYITRELSRTRLTHPMIESGYIGSPMIDTGYIGSSSNCASSTVTSALSEPLSPSNSDSPPDHLPPPPPGTMFVAFH